MNVRYYCVRPGFPGEKWTVRKSPGQTVEPTGYGRTDRISKLEAVRKSREPSVVACVSAISSPNYREKGSGNQCHRHFAECIIMTAQRSERLQSPNDQKNPAHLRSQARPCRTPPSSGDEKLRACDFFPARRARCHLTRRLRRRGNGE